MLRNNYFLLKHSYSAFSIQQEWCFGVDDDRCRQPRLKSCILDHMWRECRFLPFPPSSRLFSLYGRYLPHRLCAHCLSYPLNPEASALCARAAYWIKVEAPTRRVQRKQEGLASIARDDPSPLPGMHRDHNALPSQTDGQKDGHWHRSISARCIYYISR